MKIRTLLLHSTNFVNICSDISLIDSIVLLSQRFLKIIISNMYFSEIYRTVEQCLSRQVNKKRQDFRFKSLIRTRRYTRKLVQQNGVIVQDINHFIRVFSTLGFALNVILKIIFILYLIQYGYNTFCFMILVHYHMIICVKYLCLCVYMFMYTCYQIISPLKCHSHFFI